MDLDQRIAEVQATYTEVLREAARLEGALRELAYLKQQLTVEKPSFLERIRRPISG